MPAPRAWFDASGTVGAPLAGELYLDDDPTRFGLEGIPPCSSTWSLAASE